MSSIFVSIGQCGNQLASTLVDQLLASGATASPPTAAAAAAYLFTYYDQRVRLVSVDSEAKVIDGLYEAPQRAAVLRVECFGVAMVAARRNLCTAPPAIKCMVCPRNRSFYAHYSSPFGNL